MLTPPMAKNRSYVYRTSGCVPLLSEEFVDDLDEALDDCDVITSVDDNSSKNISTKTLVFGCLCFAS